MVDRAAAVVAREVMRGHSAAAEDQEELDRKQLAARGA
jgi:hypothetical protein